MTPYPIKELSESRLPEVWLGLLLALSVISYIDRTLTSAQEMHPSDSGRGGTGGFWRRPEQSILGVMLQSAGPG